jgi:hypothetical protein
MGYDLFVRAGRAHTTYARRDELTAYFEQRGFRRNGTIGWLCDRPELWLEAYLAAVTEGLDGGDVTDREDELFNEAQCHPRPWSLPALALVLGIADVLGWEIYDPQIGRLVRAAGVQVGAPALGPSADPRELHTVARDEWQGHARAIAPFDGGIYLGYDTPTVGGVRGGVDRRTGDALAVERRVADVRQPQLSPDGRWLCVAARYDQERQLDTTVHLLDPETLELARELRLRSAAWLPDRPATLVAVDERGGQARLVAVEVATGHETAFEPQELVGTNAAYQATYTVVTPDGAHVVVCTPRALHVFSTETGRLLHRVGHGGTIYTVATTCGLVAVATITPHGAEAIFLHAASGRIALRLGSDVGGRSLALAAHPSGWFALGTSHAVTILGLDGSLRALGRVLDGEVHTLAVAGDALVVGGAPKGLVYVPLLPDETRAVAPVAIADRPLAFGDAFAGAPVALATDLHTLTTISVDRIVERLLASSGDVDENIEAYAARCPSSLDVMVARARRAALTGTSIDPRHDTTVAALVFQHPGCRDELAEIIAAIPDARRDEIITARRDEPSWTRFSLHRSPATLAVLVEVIAALPKGAFTKLKSVELWQYRNGYSAKALQQNAITALVGYGSMAEPAIDAVLANPANAKLPTRAWFVEARKQLTASGGNM